VALKRSQSYLIVKLTQPYLTLYFSHYFSEILHCNQEASLFTFSARYLCWSAAQNAPPAGPLVVHFMLPTNRNSAQKKKKHYNLMHHLKSIGWELKG